MKGKMLAPERQVCVFANAEAVAHAAAQRLIELAQEVIKERRRIIFLVSGTGKAERLAEVLRGARDPQKLPPQLLQPVNGSLFWLIDKDAASQL